VASGTAAAARAADDPIAVLPHVDDDAVERADSGSTECAAAVARAGLEAACSGSAGGAGRVPCAAGAWATAAAVDVAAMGTVGPPAATAGAADCRSTRENALQLLLAGGAAGAADAAWWVGAEAPPNGGSGALPLTTGRAGELDVDAAGAAAAGCC
jgi:hypothetical protein